MEAVKKGHWYFMVLILLPFLKVAVQQKEAVVTVRLEEGMVLNCLCPWNGSFSMVSWTKVPDKDPIAVFHPDYGTNFPHQYSERIEFLRRTPMDGSIALRNVTHQDIGVYHCSVQTFPQGPWTGSIQVEDLDEPPEEDDNVDEIFESSEDPTPNSFEADSELMAELNENLTISCIGLPNATMYQVIMEKMVPSQSWGIIGVCKRVDGSLISEDYSDRGSIRCADTLNIRLDLIHVQKADSGFYRCTFSTDTGVHTTTMSLIVADPGGFSLPMYMLYIYCGAGTASLLLLIAIIIVVVRNRNRNRRIEYRVKKLYPSQRRPNFYENTPECPREAKRPRQKRQSPVYANLQYVRANKTKCCV